MFGPAGINRFEEDVFGSGHVDIVFVMEGVNDISHPVDLKKPEEMPTADELIRGMKTLADIAHRHKARIYLCTILPFGGSAAWNDKLESVRQQVNKWICRAGYADGFYDFELIISAENKGVRLDEGYHVGDYLHPNADGGKKIAAGINIDTLMADVSCQ
jgi:lysophospholipase L1-like esterase